MELRSHYQPLARRLLGHYLMFGLTSIVVVSIGWMLLGRTLLLGGDERELVSRINEVRSLLVADQTRNGGVGTKTLIELLGTEEWVTYAGVIGIDGNYTAHSKPGRIGKPSESRLTQDEQQSVVERHVFWNDGKRQREYWAPLGAGDRSFGCLQVGVVDQADGGWIQRLTDWVPYAIATPLLILVIGGIFLKGAAQTNAAIEDQLCAVSANGPAVEFRLKPLDEPSPAAIGWNRVVERASGQKVASNLETKLSQTLGSLHEKRSERILNSLSDGVALTDKDGCIIFTNRPLGVLLQQSLDASKLRGRPIQDLFPPRANLQMSTSQESRAVVFEVQLGDVLTDGVLRVGRAPLLGEENASVSQHLWTVRDITQQKLSDEMRNQFVYSATHELRTPLTNIKAYAETLTLNEIADPELQKGFLNIINSEATRLARFVEELLNVSQMEAGAMSLVRTEVETERLLQEVAEKVRPQMLQKQITFETLMPPKLPKLHVDKDKFVGALINLLSNAAKYTPNEGRVAFKVASSAKDIQISVEDTGYGISEAELPKLFTKFYRSADVRIRDVPGSGLGLAFAQEVARLHGGKLTVHSELDKGSQFTLIIPIL
jgi:signal transduction histidine kinase